MDDAARRSGVGQALAATPRHVLDAWLLQRFPGRTLEELDNIDLPRLLRAVRVEQIDQTEQLRRTVMDRQSTAKLSSADWRRIRRNDALLRRWDGEQ